MRLFSFREEDQSKLSKSLLVDAEACFLFYLYNGRNAWHSTWATQYSEGCMHTGLEAAKNSAESRRTQGSVFYIKQIPSLVLRSVDGFIAISQINTAIPLQGYSVNATEKISSEMAKILDDHYDRCIAKGVPIYAAARSFAYYSRFWNTHPRSENSVIVVASNDTNVRLSPIKKSLASKWQSISNGGAYRLSWVDVGEQKLPPDFSKSVTNLARVFHR